MFAYSGSMLLVKTKIGPSKISGMGLFADEFIKAGTKVWIFEPVLDLTLTKKEIEKLSPVAQEQFHRYAYVDKFKKKYVLCGDDSRFLNHSEVPNCDETGTDDTTYSLRDINIDEEMTVNYKEFYDNMNEHPEIK